MYVKFATQIKILQWLKNDTYNHSYNNSHDKIDKNMLKTPLMTVAGIALKDQVDLISKKDPFELVANHR